VARKRRNVSYEASYFRFEAADDSPQVERLVDREFKSAVAAARCLRAAFESQTGPVEEGEIEVWIRYATMTKKVDGVPVAQIETDEIDALDWFLK
jgi:hypothetical protein